MHFNGKQNRTRVRLRIISISWRRLGRDNVTNQAFKNKGNGPETSKQQAGVDT